MPMLPVGHTLVHCPPRPEDLGRGSWRFQREVQVYAGNAVKYAFTWTFTPTDVVESEPEGKVTSEENDEAATVSVNESDTLGRSPRFSLY